MTGLELARTELRRAIYRHAAIQHAACADSHTKIIVCGQVDDAIERLERAARSDERTACAIEASDRRFNDHERGIRNELPKSEIVEA